MRGITIILLSLISLFSEGVYGQFIHRDGMDLVDSTGNRIELKGVFLDNWLFWTGSSWGCGFVSQSRIEERLVKVIGQGEFDKFEQRVYDEFITSADIDSIAAMGFNVVRLPINHKALEMDEELSYNAPGWAKIDSLIKWCRANGIYVVLDLHAAPGGQSWLFVSDPDQDKLWDKAYNKLKTVKIWEMMASRYKDEPVVAGYDLLNEPDPRDVDDLLDIYERIIEAIRKLDKNHLIILEGDDYSKDFSFFIDVLDSNMCYSYHTYNLLGKDRTEEELMDLHKLAKLQQIPIWNSEFGANDLVWIKEKVRMFDAREYNNSGWVFWPWKRAATGSPDRYRMLMVIDKTSEWEDLARYISGWGLKPDKQEALDALDAMMESFRIENCTVDREVLTTLKGSL